MSSVVDDDATTAVANMRKSGTGFAMPALVALLLAAIVGSLSIGRYGVGLGDLSTLLLGWLGIGPGRVGVAEPVWRVVELVRVPRMLIGGFVGAGLALSGAVLQGVFRNPLVDPHVIGVSSGAAFGGVFAILLGFGAAALWSMAFAFGLVALLLVVLMSRKSGRSSVLMLVLSGVVISALFSALVSLATYLADPNDTLPAIVFWLMGSFASATPERALYMLPIVTVFALPLMLMRFRINILSLGDEEARGLGLKIEPTRWLVLCCVTGITAASVANSGIIGWVGLVVPHFARSLVGPDHRRLLPASALLGASFMLFVDVVARSLIPAEIPLGVLTAIVGAPVFMVLLHRTHNEGW
ncbi:MULTISPECIES: iron ABC transporter permease [Hyphomicrobiales]|jgi:iron complex transport system permease protein|uniref:FecCD family ABC transporter permease n=1 Tax=Hyphomicrobiales TaxID=356 RepID=UPI00036C9630|nr:MULTISPECIES: iron ABC transporter permease [Phyllobacteriaceae]MCX8570983.1 iron ABC transporter permease [Aminobacter sp. MET-1]